MTPAYTVVERGTCRLLASWWTPVCEIAQAEAAARGGIAVAASFLRSRTGLDVTLQFPSFGYQPDNNRSPSPESLQIAREEIRTHEHHHRLASRRVA
jgi:hypothetical protein